MWPTLTQGVFTFIAYTESYNISKVLFLISGKENVSLPMPVLSYVLVCLSSSQCYDWYNCMSGSGYLGLLHKNWQDGGLEGNWTPKTIKEEERWL